MLPAYAGDRIPGLCLKSGALCFVLRLTLSLKLGLLVKDDVPLIKQKGVLGVEPPVNGKVRPIHPSA